MNPFAWLLSLLFPVRASALGKTRDWEFRFDPESFDEQGSIGIPQRKRYRNGIERHFAEERLRARTENSVYVRSHEYAIHG